MSKNNIQTQIQSLRTHPHIKKLQQIDNRLIQMVYYPKSIKSAYSKSEYRIKIQLPFKYPEDPPTVKFIDPINHINVNQKTGEVMMPIIVQDWSPYISLYIIIDVLDALLIDPELSSRYCVGSEKSHRYIRDKSKLNQHSESIFLKKVEDIPIFKTLEQEQISMIKKLSTQRKDELSEEELKPIGTMKKRLKRLKTIILQKSNKIQGHEEKQKVSVKFDKIEEEQSFVLNQQSQQDFKGKINKRQKIQINQLPIVTKTKESKLSRDAQFNIFENFKLKDSVESKQSPISLIPKIKSLNNLSIPTPKKQKQQYQKSIETKRKNQQKPTEHKKSSSTIFFENTAQNLYKINRMIQVFTNELNELQKKKMQTKNEYFTKIIESKIEEQIKMLEELEELASSIKKSMLNNLKMQISK